MSEVKYKICPRCGGTMFSNSGGWTCNNCGSFETADGRVYPVKLDNDNTINIPPAPLASFNWQAFRAEAAKDILCALLSRVERFYTCVTDDSRHKVSYHDDFVRIAIRDADELIKQLKEDGK